MEINRILIADDHGLILTGIREILENAFTVNYICALSDPKEVSAEAAKRDYDLYILDLEYRDMSGFELIKEVRKKHTESKIIICTMHEEVWNANRLVDMDVDGIVLKKSACEYLKEAVTSVLNNKKYYCPRFKHLSEQTSSYRRRVKNKNSQLTRQELQVLKYIAKGYTSKEIADIFSVTDDTIEAHRKNMFIKLEAKNVAHLVSIAISKGFIE